MVVNGGGTAFFNAIKNACHKLNTAREGEPAARVLIVLSDRDDNESNTTLAQAIDDTAKTTRPQRIACRVTFGAASHSGPRHPGEREAPLLSLASPPGTTSLPHGSWLVKQAFGNRLP